jgi:hypothetical protein
MGHKAACVGNKGQPESLHRTMDILNGRHDVIQHVSWGSLMELPKNKWRTNTSLHF